MDKELFQFIKRAAKATYAGGGKYEENPERPGFNELVYTEGEYSYRDSYTGFIRSRGMEVVRQNNKPLWSSLYGGGMVEGKAEMASQTFGFLRRAISSTETGFLSFRGPHNFKDTDWEYKYTQEGDVNEFSGYEEIYYKQSIIFFHRIIGGIIRHISS